MAKGLRSKVKKVFRTLRRQAVSQAPWQMEAERKRQEAIQAVLNAPKPEINQTARETDEMERDEEEKGAGVTKMDADIDALPELTTKNPSKIIKKLRARRLSTAKGITPGKIKKSKPLAGANQFHKKKKKKRS